jgi:hypothetical protein
MNWNKLALNIKLVVSKQYRACKRLEDVFITMNSGHSENVSTQNSLFTMSPIRALGEVTSALKMSVVGEFLQNLSKYSEIYMQLDRDPALTNHLCRVGRQVRNVERLWTKLDLIDVIRWKRLHPLRKRITQSAPELEQRLNEALTTGDGEDRVEALCGMQGFGPVLASAILTLTWPETYGFMDYHSWTALRALSFDVSDRQFSGGGFTISEYLHFLTIIRQLADQVGSSPAQIADALYAHDNVRRRHNRT